MYREAYTKKIRQVLDYVDRTQQKTMDEISAAMAQSVLGGGTVFAFDNGHFVRWELFCKNGSLACVKRLDFVLKFEGLSADIKPAPSEGLAGHILKSVGAKSGDILVVGSVSGASINVVDLPIEARKLGITTVGIVSLPYSKSIPPIHSCGKKLYEVCDFVIDNGAPAGDAMLSGEGLPVPICPASGISVVYIWWKLIGLLTEKLLSRGYRPVFAKDFAGESITRLGQPQTAEIADVFATQVRALFDKIDTASDGAIRAACDVLANAALQHKRVHLFDSDEILDCELFNRAGGPVMFRRLQYKLEVINDVYQKLQKGIGFPFGLSDLAFRQSGAQEGDVIFIGGRAAADTAAVEAAKSAKRLGLKTIAVTCGSGGLRDICDLTLDTFAEKDYLVTVDGMGEMLPKSGIAGVYSLWTVVAALADKMIACGRPIGFYKSLNFPGSIDYYNRIQSLYEQDGIGFAEYK